ncbi:MAG: glycosyltransferase [Pseudomonadota bacterium]
MRTRKLRVCLAGSGGGHVRQLLDLRPLWADRDYFFVTEDTALGRSIAADHHVAFVPHVALGQARLGAPIHMLRAAINNVIRSAGIIWKTKPDVVITTGAGSVFFTSVWARILGAKIVTIDSFARFLAPSVFARAIGPISHVRIAQSPASAERWQNALCFDPFLELDAPRPIKKPLLFATVGATLPFDRLTSMVAHAKTKGLIPEDVLVQTGVGGVRPDGVRSCETMPYDEMNRTLREADIVVCHGGTGSLITALRQGCRVITIPRRFDRGEHYDDHQCEITNALAARGLVAVADTDEEFAAALQAVRASEPISATTDPSQLIGYLNDLLEHLEQDGAAPPATHQTA